MSEWEGKRKNELLRSGYWSRQDKNISDITDEIISQEKELVREIALKILQGWCCDDSCMDEAIRSDINKILSDYNIDNI